MFLIKDESKQKKFYHQITILYFVFLFKCIAYGTFLSFYITFSIIKFLLYYANALINNHKKKHSSINLKNKKFNIKNKNKNTTAYFFCLKTEYVYS